MRSRPLGLKLEGLKLKLGSKQQESRLMRSTETGIGSTLWQALGIATGQVTLEIDRPYHTVFPGFVGRT
jgi:hypothetical protein